MVKEDISRKEEKGLFERLGPSFVIISVILAFAVGVLWEKVGNLEGNGTETTSKATPTTAKTQQDAPTVSLNQVKGLFDKDIVKFGNSERKVLFVEISDPSCPYCQIAGGKNPELSGQNERFKYVSSGGTYVPPVPEMKKLIDQGKASFAYIYTNGHGAGEMGAKAMYCAFEKGKYWEVHDLLYTNKGYELMNNTVKNDKSKAGDLAAFLKSAVSESEMKACLESGKYDSRLASDSSLAKSLGVTGTPGFLVNSTVFRGAYSYKDMESAVTTALK